MVTVFTYISGTFYLFFTKEKDMGVHRSTKKTGYGLGQALNDIPYGPIISTRAPAATDVCPLGTMWVTTATDAVYVLTSITAGAATWTTVS